MVRRASEKKTFLWCFREVILISVYAHSPPHLFILSLSIWRRFFFFYFCTAKLELGYCCYFF